MAGQPSQEVQLLLAAEKRAMERVAEARQRKNERLKRAKEEAAAEIEQFKGERHINFTKYESDHNGSKDDVAKTIDRDTCERLEAMKKSMQGAKTLMLDRLIGEVVNRVDAKLHPNKRVEIATI